MNRNAVNLKIAVGLDIGRSMKAAKPSRISTPINKTKQQART